jgi:hypothetical protein
LSCSHAERDQHRAGEPDHCRYLSVESRALVLEDEGDPERKEVKELQPA